jgi:hypothetical protein
MLLPTGSAPVAGVVPCLNEAEPIGGTVREIQAQQVGAPDRYPQFAPMPRTPPWHQEGTQQRQRPHGAAASCFRPCYTASLFCCAYPRRGSSLLHDLGDHLPPSIVVNGTAAYPEKAPLPTGVELQVQLLDASRQPAQPNRAAIAASTALPPLASMRKPAVEERCCEEATTLSAKIGRFLDS